MHLIRLEESRERIATSWSLASSSKEATVFSHNIATIWTTLGDIIGSPLKPTTTGKARMLSCTASALSDQTDSPQVLLSPYLVQRPSDLSDTLAGTDPDVEDGNDEGVKVGKLIPKQKMKMGWYKVPRSIFYYAPSVVDPVLI